MKTYALIGCGGIGQYHLNHLLQFTDITAVAFCDLIPERAAAFVQQAGGQAFADYRQMLATVRPDMLFICVPPDAHGDIERETIRHRIPFFVEKPVALDLDLAVEIRDAVAAAGLITAVGFQCRYSSLVVPTRDFIRKNEIAFIQCARIGGIPDVIWWKNKARSGGQIVEQTIHQFDLIRCVFAEPVEVFSMGTQGFVRDIADYNTDDLSVSVIRFAGGALASIATGCYALDGAACDSKLTFSGRQARLDHYLLQRVEQFGDDLANADPDDSGLVVQGDGTLLNAGNALRTVTESGQAGLACDRTFVDAVLSGNDSRIRSPYADAVKSLAFTLACNQSMASSRPVAISQLLPD